MSRVLVETFSVKFSQRDVEEEFRVYGAIRSVKPGRPGYAWVEFNDRRDALNAVAGTLAGNSSRDVQLLDDSNVGIRRRANRLNGRRVDRRGIHDHDEEPTEFEDVKLVESVAQVVLKTVKRFNSMDKILKDLDVGPTEFEKSAAQVVRRTIKRFDSMDKIRKDLDVGRTEFEESVAQVFPKSLDMSTKKVLKDFAPIELEESVAQALFDLEHTNRDLKDDLYIDSATQVNVSANCQAILIRYPYKLHEGFRKIHGKLVRQLEKKFRGNVVILVGRGRPAPPGWFSFLVLCDDLLSDIVYPAEIRGFRPASDHVLNCCLDSNARNDTKDKLDAFAAVFRKLCWLNVEFDYL